MAGMIADETDPSAQAIRDAIANSARPSAAVLIDARGALHVVGKDGAAPDELAELFERAANMVRRRADPDPIELAGDDEPHGRD